ncbi:MAG: CDP-alcohol phosphatidyltransferase family protein [Candidatus Binatia bacterium]
MAVVFAGRVARWLIPFARRAELTPNQVTSASLAVTLAAAVITAFGHQTAWVVAGLLVQVGFVLDCLDGQLARATGRVTEAGRYFDSVTDPVKVFALISAMTVALLRHREGTVVCALGAAAFFAFVLYEQHMQLVRRLPDRAQKEDETSRWTSGIRFAGQRIDLVFAIGEVLMTITVGLFFGRLRAALLVLALVLPIQFAVHARRFLRRRDPA